MGLGNYIESHNHHHSRDIEHFLDPQKLSLASTTSESLKYVLMFSTFNTPGSLSGLVTWSPRFIFLRNIFILILLRRQEGTDRFSAQ